jgi:hypothetical protein
VKPPPTLACCLVSEYAILDRNVEYVGSNLFQNGKELGPVPCLALAQSKDGVFLFHCDASFQILGTELQPSLAEAKQSAEHAYRGSSKMWVATGFTREEADKHLDEIWGPMRCVLCKKRPFELEDAAFVQKGDAFICELCIRAASAMLSETE